MPETPRIVCRQTMGLLMCPFLEITELMQGCGLQAVRFICHLNIAADSSSEEDDDEVHGLGWLHISSAGNVAP